jgi:hypothetical protein
MALLSARVSLASIISVLALEKREFASDTSLPSQSASTTLNTMASESPPTGAITFDDILIKYKPFYLDSR